MQRVRHVEVVETPIDTAALVAAVADPSAGATVVFSGDVRDHDHGRAVATLTYVYSDSTAVLGPLATFAEPHCYDLCAVHSDRLTAPRGWEVVRLAPDPDALKPTSDDLEALANAVRDAARPRSVPESEPDL